MAEDYDPTLRITSRVRMASDTSDEPRLGSIRERHTDTNEYGVEWDDTPEQIERIATISAMTGAPQLVRA